MREIEIDALPTRLDAETLVHADVKNLASRNVSGHEVSELRVAFLEEVPAVVVGNISPGACIVDVARDPDPAALAASRSAAKPPGKAATATSTPVMSFVYLRRMNESAPP